MEDMDADMEAGKALDLDKEQQVVELFHTLEPPEFLNSKTDDTETTVTALQSEKGCPESSKQCHLVPKD